MATYNADRHQHFDDLPDLSDELSAYDISNYKGRRGGKRGFLRLRNIIIMVVVAIVVVLLAYGIAFGLSAKQAKDSADLLMSQGKTLMSQLKEGDKVAADQTMADLTETTQKLNDNVSSPLWSIATCFPVYGTDVKDVRILASVANMLCDEAAAPIVAAVPAEGLKGIVADGGVNVQATANLLSAVETIRPTLQVCANQIDEMEEPNLEQLKKPVATLKSAIVTLDSLSQYAGDIAQLLPGMLGANGAPTTYLLTAVNNAEPRPRGGMPGSFAVVTVTDGKIDLGSIAGVEVAPRLEEGNEAAPVLTEEEIQIFGTRVGLDIRDSSFIPNFPRAAELEAALWVANGNQPVDGVIMLDPLFLQQLLVLVGGVTTSDGTVVDGTNAAQQLMNEVYLRYPDDNVAQDSFFAEVAGLAFSQVINRLGSASPIDLIETIADAVKDNRLSIWISNPDYEALLVKLDAAGTTPTSEMEPVTGIYYGANYGTKSGWYLDCKTSLGEGKKNADGSTSYEISVELVNTLTENSGLNGYIIGGGDPYQQAPEDMVIDLYLFAPVGGSISGLQVEGEFVDAATVSSIQGSFHGTLGPDAMTKANYNGVEVWYGLARLHASSSAKLAYTVTTSTQAISNLTLDVTPMANENI